MKTIRRALLLVLALSALCSASGVGTFAQAPADSSTPYRMYLPALFRQPAGLATRGFRFYRYSPSVIFWDGQDSTTLEVGTSGLGIAGVYVDWNDGWKQLFDDGTHGDRVPRDNVYAVNGLRMGGPGVARYRMWFEGHHMTLDPLVRIVHTAGYEEVISGCEYGAVTPGETVPWVDLGGGVSATRSAFFIVDASGEIVPGMPVIPIYPGIQLGAATRKLYSVLADAFDVVIVMPNSKLFDSQELRESVPFSRMIKNDVQHIGVPTFDEAAQYGSAGRLRSVIYHSWGVGTLLDREMIHAWGVRLGAGLGLASVAAEGWQGQWAPWSDVNGQASSPLLEGGIAGYLVYNGDGTWRVEPDKSGTKPYAPLELYAMGLIPPSEVPPVHILVGADYTNRQRITAHEVRTFTIEQIMAAEGGARWPACPVAQMEFNAALIAVNDRPFTAAERTFYTLVAESFASAEPGEHYLTPFFSATGGRATLSVRLPVPGLN
jgi:hypothetical protein